eukprot:m.34924 g.34924  ORF g.34924 m.34924 type:complete len:52 (+) comp11074_c3_seq1:47-202(+)
MCQNYVMNNEKWEVFLQVCGVIQFHHFGSQDSQPFHASFALQEFALCTYVW